MSVVCRTFIGSNWEADYALTESMVIDQGYKKSATKFGENFTIVTYEKDQTVFEIFAHVVSKCFFNLFCCFDSCQKRAKAAEKAMDQKHVYQFKRPSTDEDMKLQAMGKESSITSLIHNL